MGLVEIMERFPTQESCFEFLEGIRFKEGIEIKLRDFVQYWWCSPSQNL